MIETIAIFNEILHPEYVEQLRLIYNESGRYEIFVLYTPKSTLVYKKKRQTILSYYLKKYLVKMNILNVHILNLV